MIKSFQAFLHESLQVGDRVRIKDSSLVPLKEQGAIAGDPGLGKITELLGKSRAKVMYGLAVYELNLSDLRRYRERF